MTTVARTLAAAALTVVLGNLAACADTGNVTVSDPAKQASNAALCATGKSSIASLAAGGAAAKAAAYLIRDNTTDVQVKKAANLVIANPGDRAAAAALTKVINRIC